MYTQQTYGNLIKCKLNTVNNPTLSLLNTTQSTMDTGFPNIEQIIPLSIAFIFNVAVLIFGRYGHFMKQQFVGY